MSEEDKGFKIKDRRTFAQEEQTADRDKKENKTADSPQAQKNAEQPLSGEIGDQIPLPKINFSTFVVSLNASAFVHLGMMEDPASGKKVKNLAMAKQTIDILSMLQEKTVGNLSADEEKMLKSILYDLKINYVKEKG